MILKCQYCFNTFSTVRGSRKYCSMHCSGKANHPIRKPFIENDYAKVELASGEYALIDIEDIPLVGKNNWKVDKSPRGVKYAINRSSGKVIFMHRLILGLTDPKIIVDHKNWDGLDNRKNNLRLCTKSQNMANSRKRKSKYSSYKGLCLSNGKWVVHLIHNRKQYSLGSFSDEKEAALAYDKAAIKYFGEFARLNFPKGALGI